MLLRVLSLLFLSLSLFGGGALRCVDMAGKVPALDALRKSEAVKSSMEYYDKFARSLNRNVLSPMRKIAAKGLRPDKGKEVPTAITTYDVDAREPEPVLENDEAPKLLDSNEAA